MVTVLKKGDIVIIASVVTAFVLSLLFWLPFSKQGNRVIVKQNNEIIYNKSIYVNHTITTDSNTIVIKDGVVYVSDADCKNQVCVKSGKISKKGESILCLPNKTIVTIE